MHLTFRSRLAALKREVPGALPGWGFAAGVVLCGLVGCWYGDAEASVRVAGTGLQLLGVATVAVGLNELRRMFGRPSMLFQTAQWFRRVGRIVGGRPHVVNATLNAQAGALTVGVGEARLRHAAGENPTLERRVAVLEENFKLLENEVEGKVTAVRAEIGTVRTGLDRERTERSSGIASVERQIEQVAIGGLQLEEVGLSWIVAGTIASGFSPEIADVFASYWR